MRIAKTNKLMKKIMLLFITVVLSYQGFSQEKPEVVHLWKNGAPGFENRKDEPEQAQDWWVKNIHNPSITVFPASKDKATGAAILVCPGGGHKALVYNSEGVDAAKFLNGLGVTAFVLKYRLAREENSPYDLNIHPQQDAYRAMRLIRSRASEWGVDPNRLGIMGFSAGGEVVASVAYGSGDGDSQAEDPVDRLNGKPDFQILIYPGPLGIPDEVPDDAPPAFMIAAINDECCAPPAVDLFRKYFKKGLSAECHFYSVGAHAFNMGYRTEYRSLKHWPDRLADWLVDNGWLSPEGKSDLKK